MERTWKADYEKFARTARENVAATLDNMDYPALERAAELILAAKAAGKRLHISGIGKPAHLAGYAASLFSSTGTPAYFLHGTEAVHGSCGQLVPGDVVIFISNSGETAEMKATVSAVKNNGCAVIGVSGNASSWLAQQSEVHLLARGRRGRPARPRAPRLHPGRDPRAAGPERPAAERGQGHAAAVCQVASGRKPRPSARE